MVNEKPLDKLRREIDAIDDAMHDLLLQRCEVAERIGAIKGQAGVAPLAPGREAEILRRLLARHQGRFPKATLVRLWREMIGGMVAVQAPLTVGVFMPDRGLGYLELARDHYGSYTPMMPLRSAGQVVRAVAEGSATVGIMPMPDREDAEGWWISLMGESGDLPKIISRLPFAGPGPGRGDDVEALVIARLNPEPTGYDRSWLALETMPDISRARLRSVLGAAGIEPTQMAATHRAEDGWLHLTEISGHVLADDRRLARLIEKKQPVRRAVVLGGYPVPLSAEDLSE
ncbi:MAG TPA: chorismate mutase [Rhodospirillaceae bacterium]|nr:chorismate mutase [Rhodospirillaceae bacterium]